MRAAAPAHVTVLPRRYRLPRIALPGARRYQQGGVRVIYYWATAAAQIYLLTLYAKSEQSDIDKETLRRIAAKLELLG